MNGTWQYSGFGASSHEVAHGAVEGWAWGQGDPSGGAQPPVLTFEQLCAPSLTATLPPGMTPQPLAIAEGDVIAAPTLPPATATPVEVAALPAEPAVAPAESADETAAVDSTPPYLVFGGLVVALVGVLLFVTWRRRTA